MRDHEFDGAFASEFLTEWFAGVELSVNVVWVARIERGPVYSDASGDMGDTFNVVSIKVVDLYIGTNGLMLIYDRKPGFKREVDTFCHDETVRRIERGMVLNERD